jgi:hypothetical protein
MMYYTFPALVLIALSTATAAAPTTDTNTTSVVPFIFSQWIEDVIANPDGDH